MAYRQYTQCVDLDKWLGKQYAQVIIAAAAVAFAAAWAGAAFVPGVLITVLTAIIAYCRWWLYDRLICLGRDVCCVGWVLKVEPPSEKTGLDKLDTDYSVNLVLPPHTVGTGLGDLKRGAPLDDLILETDALAAYTDLFGAHLDFNGNPVQQWGNDPPTVCMHAEFEGGGVWDLLQASKTALALAVIAAAVCGIPVFGWIACVILSVAAAIVTLAGLFAALNDVGNPDDVETHLGEIHQRDPTGNGADVLVVQGTWVYDSAHEGWNEIHPIKHCQRTNLTWNGRWDVDGEAYTKGWCEMIARAQDPLTVSSQQAPGNQWVVHPVVDGCDQTDVPEATPPLLH